MCWINDSQSQGNYSVQGLRSHPPRNSDSRRPDCIIIASCMLYIYIYTIFFLNSSYVLVFMDLFIPLNCELLCHLALCDTLQNLPSSEKPTPLRQSEFLHATLRWVPWEAVTSVGSMGGKRVSHLSTLRIPDCKFHAKPKV